MIFPSFTSICDKPQLLEAFVGEVVTDISCGSNHSAAIVNNSDLYTWGLGDYGRLGHGDEVTQIQPKLVRVLSLTFSITAYLIYPVILIQKPIRGSKNLRIHLKLYGEVPRPHNLFRQNPSDVIDEFWRIMTDNDGFWRIITDNHGFWRGRFWGGGPMESSTLDSELRRNSWSPRCLR